MNVWHIYIDMRIKKPNGYLGMFSNIAVRSTRAAIFHTRYIDIFTLRSPYAHTRSAKFYMYACCRFNGPT